MIHMTVKSNDVRGRLVRELTEERKRRNWSLQTVVDKSDLAIKRANLRHWESGRATNTPTLGQFQRWASAFGWVLEVNLTTPEDVRVSLPPEIIPDARALAAAAPADRATVMRLLRIMPQMTHKERAFLELLSKGDPSVG